MSRITKAQLQANYQRGLEVGFAQGRDYYKAEASKDLNTEKVRAVVQLINAAGQAMQAQAQIMQGLANALDNIGGIR